MDELYLAAHAALIAYQTHWRRSYIEASHGVIERTQTHYVRRMHVEMQHSDIEDVVRELAIINI